MTFRILHISDIHFGPHCRFKRPTPKTTATIAADALLGNLEKQGLDSGYRAVVISGDLTWQNQPKEFETSHYFINELSARIGVPLGGFVVIPGNHDITWSEADPKQSRKFRYLLREQAERQYRKFVVATLGVSPAEYLSVAKIFESERVVIAGLNSCRLHEKLNAGLGYVGRDQIEEVISSLRDNEVYRDFENEFFKIAVLHHHLLPAVDLNLKELENPPHKRRFSLVTDANTVLDLLLADNFALVLHGHLHVPFYGVERRFPVVEGAVHTAGESHIGVVAAGSLSVDAVHAEQNHYAVIDVDEYEVTIRGFGIVYDDPVVADPFSSVSQIERALLTRPATQLSIKPKRRLLNRHRQLMEESAVLAEKIFEKDIFATRFLFRAVFPVCDRNPLLMKLNRRQLRALFDSVLDAWSAEKNALERYELQKKRHGVTFTEYIFRLMIATHES